MAHHYPTLAIRPLHPGDIPNIVNYWLQGSKEDLERIGVDPAKIPSEDQFQAGLLKICHAPDDATDVSYLIWLVDDVAIGFSSLKNIRFGKTGEMHLHMWNPSYTGKGYGAILFCESAVEFYRKFQLQSIKCEPRAANPMPNGMFARVGFPLVKTHVAASSELSLVCELNHYDIDLAVAQQYLKSAGAA